MQENNLDDQQTLCAMNNNAERKYEPCQSLLSSRTPPPTLVISGTSSGVGKTTVAVGLMAAFSRRGLIVQPYKVGPDFLDGMHHETACKEDREKTLDDKEAQPKQFQRQRRRSSVNLDDWMMGGAAAVQESYLRHAEGADICVVEGCMGLFDGRDGASDVGSTSAVAKWLQAPVVLVVNASSMARSVAATVLGYSQLDAKLSVAAIVANLIGSSNHLHWIQEAIEAYSNILVDNATQKPVLLVGGLPRNQSVVIPERHLGLHMPSDKNSAETSCSMDALANFMESNLNVDALLDIAQRPGRSIPPMISPPAQPITKTMACCRIGVAQDEAFCFYYQDNLNFLEQAGADLVRFSPIRSEKLPSQLDALYLGGGYPELYAKQLEDNHRLKRDILGYVQAGGAVFAECGGFMYLTDAIYTSLRNKNMKNDDNNTSATAREGTKRFDMCGVFSNKVVRMTPHMKMFYAQLEFTKNNPIFPAGSICRGQKFHFSELVELSYRVNDDESSSMLVYPQTPSDKGKQLLHDGYTYKSSFASYYHLHFASNPKLAQHFVEKALQHSPCRKFAAVSFVSAATEIVFALGAGHVLGGVSSVCTSPAHAKDAPRMVISSTSPILDDVESRSSEEVAAEMKRLQQKQKERQNNGKGPPGHWVIDTKALRTISPRIAFVQNSCAICDPNQDDALAALQDAGLLLQSSNNKIGGASDGNDPTCQVIQVSPTTLKGIFDSIEAVSAALNIQEKGRDLVSHLKERLGSVQSALKEKNSRHKPLRVISLEGLAPPCTGGGWLPDMKQAAGCADAFGDEGGAKPQIRSWEEILAVNPDVLILSPCSAAPSRTFRELHLVASQPCFWKLDCVRKGDVYILDHSWFSRPGIKVVDGIEMLATLLNGIPLPSKVLDGGLWKGQAYKYQCQVDGKNVSHCTTELSGRFAPCFGELEESNGEKPQSESKTEFVKRLQKCSVVRCTKPGSPLPASRCAHNLVSLCNERFKLSLLLFGGEDKHSKRNAEVWMLRGSEQTWKKLPTTAEDERSLRRPVWEPIACGKTADENVPTPRSNAAVGVCGLHLVVFGGWGQDNNTPLSHCELLHLESFCWTHCSTRNNREPPPRGNPTLVYSERNHCVIMFGGWDRHKRYNDLWCLDMNTWEWKVRSNETGSWPRPRTDHSAVMWVGSDCEERMMLFGGSVDGLGPTNELWALNCSSKDLDQWSWEKIVPVSHPDPCPRTSHAMAIVGEADAATIIVSGGNMSGVGKSSIVGDAWAWHCKDRKWHRLDWTGTGVERCRHGMVNVCGTIVIWGGFDGDEVISEEANCWAALYNYNNQNACAKKLCTATNDRRLQERWEAEIPMRSTDLPSDILEKAQESKLPGALHKALHRYAVANNRDTYIDPESGYSVFTQLYLKRQPCCGNGCRHCPWGHVNVPKKSNAAAKAVDLDW